MLHGFLRVGAAVPELKVADSEFNSKEIIKIIESAHQQGVKIITFPELSVTAYTCGDLFLQEALIKGSDKAVCEIISSTIDKEIVAIIGAPYRYRGKLYNCAFVINNGKLIGIVPKVYIPNYTEFYEARWFVSGLDIKNIDVFYEGYKIPFGTDLIFEDENNPQISFGIEICEDLWVASPPSSELSVGGATLIFNPSSSNEIVGKSEYRKDLVRIQSAKCVCAYIYASSGVGESSTDLVFGGHGIISEYGSILAESERFDMESQVIMTDVDVERLWNERQKNMSFSSQGSEALKNNVTKTIKFRYIKLNELNFTSEIMDRNVAPHPFVPSDVSKRDERCEEIFSIQTSGLAKRLKHIGLKFVVIGISGGLDSTLALLVTAKAFDMLKIPRQNIIAITMPGFGTTDRTYNNALTLIKNLGAQSREIDIKAACLQHFEDIKHDRSIHDVTYENVQARERTQLLMDIANKEGAIVIGTGDMSELALGWCTYNGDHMSMYGVNCGVPKTLVKYLVQWAADHKFKTDAAVVLKDILETPISPELVPPNEAGEIAQKTEDIVGPYELHDFFLYHMIRYGAAPSKILFLAQHAFANVYEEAVIRKWLKIFIKRFFSQQFKRSCLPDGPKVGSISLSPRGDWRMPSDAVAKLWLDEL